MSGWSTRRNELDQLLLLFRTYLNDPSPTLDEGVGGEYDRGVLLDVAMRMLEEVGGQAWSSKGLESRKVKGGFMAENLKDPDVANGQDFNRLLLRISELKLDPLKDFRELKTFTKGHFGSVALVKPTANQPLGSRRGQLLYVMKSLEKKAALKLSHQISYENERTVLSLNSASQSDYHPIPHLLCTLQDSISLYYIMEHIQGFNLGDLIQGRAGAMEDAVVKGLAAEIVDAIDWLHCTGWCHRDIKPSNILLHQTSPTSATYHVKLTDFGSTAPLVSSRIPRKYCKTLIGTVDYISPEILRANEDVMGVLMLQRSMEMDEIAVEEGGEAERRWIQEEIRRREDEEGEGYGKETDWWSFGVVLYEFFFGQPPFFEDNVQDTYDKISDHRNSLKFDENVALISLEARDLLSRLLTDPNERLGSGPTGGLDLRRHPFFWTSGADGRTYAEPDWGRLHQGPGLDLQAYLPSDPDESLMEEPISVANQPNNKKPFDFSAFFSSPGLSILRPTPSPSNPSTSRHYRDAPGRVRREGEDGFIGFTYEPEADAFESDFGFQADGEKEDEEMREVGEETGETIKARTTLPPATTTFFSSPPHKALLNPSTSVVQHQQHFHTPARPGLHSRQHHPQNHQHQQLPHTPAPPLQSRNLPTSNSGNSSSKKRNQRRSLTDLEAWQEMMDYAAVQSAKKNRRRSRNMQQLETSPAAAAPSPLNFDRIEKNYENIRSNFDAMDAKYADLFAMAANVGSGTGQTNGVSSGR